jgi:uncharacterized protein CbrC (UPF0167 family)
MSDALPEFLYHPDPVATGAVERSDVQCRACGRARGWIYRGPVYAIEELDDALCPWCIADGTAAAQFDAEFTDVGDDVPDDMPAEVVDTIARRTPGFSGWQQEHWLYHCGDAAVFLGPAGWDELQMHPDALAALRAEGAAYGSSSGELAEYLRSLHREGEPTAYLFRCRHCGTALAYSDFS